MPQRFYITHANDNDIKCSFYNEKWKKVFFSGWEKYNIFMVYEYSNAPGVADNKSVKYINRSSS